MAGYAKVVAEGSGEFNVTKENFAKINDAVFDLKTQIVNVKDFGATGDGVTVDTTAINDAYANAAGGLVFFPSGTYVTAGGHVIPSGVVTLGEGVGSTIISHTGDNSCFYYEEASSYVGKRAGIKDLHIKGNTGASAVGVELAAGYGFFLERMVIGENVGSAGRYTNGIALLLHNKSTNGFNEGVTLSDFHSWYNKTGIQFKRTSGTNSFGYGKWNNFSINVPVSGVGIHLAAAGEAAGQQLSVYNNEWHGNIWVDNIGGTGVETPTAIKVDPGGIFEKSNAWIRMEVLNPGTAVAADYRIQFTGAPTSATRFYLSGYFRNEGGGTMTDSYAGSAGFRITGFPVPSVPPVKTALEPLAHAAHAGLAFSTQSNEELVALWGFAGGAGKAVLIVASKAFAANPVAAFDPSANVLFWVDAGGGINIGSQAASSKIRSGTGTPEGAVLGNIGDLFLRRDGGAGTSIYVKQSGNATNTGWIGK